MPNELTRLREWVDARFRFPDDSRAQDSHTLDTCTFAELGLTLGDLRRIVRLCAENAMLREACNKAYAIMEHLGERLNAHDLAFDDEHLDTVTRDWEFVRAALSASPDEWLAAHDASLVSQLKAKETLLLASGEFISALGYAGDLNAAAAQEWLKQQLDAAKPQWQPIETVPKDGDASVLIVTAGGRMMVISTQVLRTSMETDTPAHLTLNPTHWMALPEPPATERSKP